MRKILAVAVALALCAVGAFSVHAATRYKTELLSYSQDDSTAQRTRWTDIDGCAYVILRCRSTHAAFSASTDADSTRSDSLIAFNIWVSDSACCLVNGFSGQAADSIQVPVSTTADTSKGRGMLGMTLPINKALRAPFSGSGLYTILAPVDVKALTIRLDGVLPGKYLRCDYTPLRRNTVTGGQSTAGKRVVGLKGFRLWIDKYK